MKINNGVIINNMSKISGSGENGEKRKWPQHQSNHGEMKAAKKSAPWKQWRKSLAAINRNISGWKWSVSWKAENINGVMKIINNQHQYGRNKNIKVMAHHQQSAMKRNNGVNNNKLAAKMKISEKLSKAAWENENGIMRSAWHHISVM